MDMNRFEEAELISCYKRLFLTTSDGRMVLRDLASQGLFDRTSAERDPYHTYFNEGCRSLVLGIFSKLNINVMEYLSEGMTTEDI